jgi:hypothetical protein
MALDTDFVKRGVLCLCVFAYNLGEVAAIGTEARSPRKSSASDLLGEWTECAAQNASYGDEVVKKQRNLARQETT